MRDKKLIKYFVFLLFIPVVAAFFAGDKFRYPCQDPDNWDKEICKMPRCDVTRTCPEHIFKGQRDPRLGPPKDEPNQTNNSAMVSVPQKTQGASCGQK